MEQIPCAKIKLKIVPHVPHVPRGTNKKYFM